MLEFWDLGVAPHNSVEQVNELDSPENYFQS